MSGLLALWPAALLGQTPKRVPIIGVPLVYAGNNDEIMVALRKGLRDRGYVDGENIRVEHRFADGRMGRVPALVQELVKLNVDVFVAGAEPIARIQQEASATTPIVLVAMGFDPATAGMIGSLNRPGGNITGIYARTGDTIGKQLELLKELRPGLSRVAAFYDGWGQAEIKALESLASALAVRLVPIQLTEPYDYAAAFQSAKANKIEGGIMTFSPRFYVERSKVADAALAQKFPTLSFDTGYAGAGGLMSYGPGRRETWERAAYFIDRILNGAKPSELPMEEPRAYTLAVNVRTAKAIGMLIPQSILTRADEIIR
jgi:putative ABC transport system substrate-binding protein